MPSVHAWDDWRDIGGRYHLSGGAAAIAAIGGDELVDEPAEAGSGLGRSGSNRAALRGMLDSAELPVLGRASHDAGSEVFTAESLTYGGNLINDIQFFAPARGAAALLGPRTPGRR